MFLFLSLLLKFNFVFLLTLLQTFANSFYWLIFLVPVIYLLLSIHAGKLFLFCQHDKSLISTNIVQSLLLDHSG